VDKPTVGILHPGSMGAAVAACAAANAINAEQAVRIADLLGTAAAAVVDGGVVGSPPIGSKAPTLYLSGPTSAAARVEALFAGTAV